LGKTVHFLQRRYRHPRHNSAKKSGETRSAAPFAALRTGQILFEIALEQALEGLAVAGFIAGHLVHGVVNGVQTNLTF